MSASPLAPTQEMLRQASLAVRLHQSGVLVDGDVFDVRRVPYMGQLYDEEWPQIVLRKGAQVGATSWAILLMIERMRAHYYHRGVLFGLPTADEVYDFSQSRLSRLIRENPAYFAGAVSDTDRAELKSVGGAMLYFRGIRMNERHTRRPSKLLSFPVDCLVLDERDDMDPEAVEIVRKRLDSSALRHEITMGHPSVPEFGVDLAYTDSDQRRWLVPCRACHTHTCLEDEFPGCIQPRKDGSWKRACRKCGREIFVIEGGWVAAYREREVRGYWISQLMNTTMPLAPLMEDFERVQRSGRGEAVFWNMRLGLAWANLDAVLERQWLIDLCDGQTPERTAHPGPSFLGADVGGRRIHYQIGHRDSEHHLRVDRVGEIDGMESAAFDRLYDLGQAHHVLVGVIDSMAETRAVTAFLRRVPWAWGCRYVDSHRHTYYWEPKERLVKVNRTASLDASHKTITERQVSWPRLTAHMEHEVIPQMLNLVRVANEDPKTGQVQHRWHVRGAKNDHYRHAFNYLCIAAERVGTVVRSSDEGKTEEAYPYESLERAKPGAAWQGW